MFLFAFSFVLQCGLLSLLVKLAKNDFLVGVVCILSEAWEFINADCLGLA